MPSKFRLTVPSGLALLPTSLLFHLGSILCHSLSSRPSSLTASFPTQLRHHLLFKVFSYPLSTGVSLCCFFFVSNPQHTNLLVSVFYRRLYLLSLFLVFEHTFIEQGFNHLPGLISTKSSHLIGRKCLLSYWILADRQY